MTIALEHLADGSISDRNFQKLMGLVPDSGGQSVGFRFGIAAGAWPGGSPRASDTAVTHGLGTTPTAVLVAVFASPSATWFPVVAATSYAATTFNLTAVTSDGSSPGAATAYSVAWLVLG